VTVRGQSVSGEKTGACNGGCTGEKRKGQDRDQNKKKKERQVDGDERVENKVITQRGQTRVLWKRNQRVNEEGNTKKKGGHQA